MNQPNYLDVPKNFPPTWATAYGQDIYGYWLEITLYQQILCFRWIPQGQFTMGSGENELDRSGNENLHDVRLSQGFWMADTAVTQALWQAVTGDTPSHFNESPLLPVAKVRWDYVQAFIAKIKQDYPNLALRLPREAEWEYACRAGTETPFYFGENITPEQVNYNGDYPYLKAEKGLNRRKTVVVKSLPSNAWGLYEMHGNVWEWCEDEWQENLGVEAVSDPWVAGNRTGEKQESVFRVLRGGSWSLNGRYVRSAIRLRFRPDARFSGIGFRLSLGLLS